MYGKNLTLSKIRHKIEAAWHAGKSKRLEKCYDTERQIDLALSIIKQEGVRIWKKNVKRKSEC